MSEFYDSLTPIEQRTSRRPHFVASYGDSSQGSSAQNGDTSSRCSVSSGSYSPEDDDDDEDSEEAFQDVVAAFARAGTYLLVGADRGQLDMFYNEYCDPCQTSMGFCRSTDSITVGMSITNAIASAVEHEGTCSVRFSLPSDQLDTPFVNYICQETQASCFFDVCGPLQKFYESINSLESIDALVIFPSARIDTFPLLPPAALACVNRMTEHDVVIVPGEANYLIPELSKPSLLRNALWPKSGGGNGSE